MGLNKFKINWVLNEELAVGTAPQKQKDLEKHFHQVKNHIMVWGILLNQQI